MPKTTPRVKTLEEGSQEAWDFLLAAYTNPGHPIPWGQHPVSEEKHDGIHTCPKTGVRVLCCGTYPNFRYCLAGRREGKDYASKGYFRRWKQARAQIKEFAGSLLTMLLMLVAGGFGL